VVAFEVRRYEAPDLPYHPVIWPSWALWRFQTRRPVNDLVKFRDAERPWGDGMTAWTEVEWPVKR
jgi:hypothetical protein